MKADLERLIDQMIGSGILFEEALHEFEKLFILRVVDRHHHNLSRAAAELGIHRNTLARRVAQYETVDQTSPSPPRPSRSASSRRG
jgi:DNA-binding protein Fis